MAPNARRSADFETFPAGRWIACHFRSRTAFGRLVWVPSWYMGDDEWRVCPSNRLGVFFGPSIRFFPRVGRSTISRVWAWKDSSVSLFLIKEAKDGRSTRPTFHLWKGIPVENEMIRPCCDSESIQGR